MAQEKKSSRFFFVFARIQDCNPRKKMISAKNDELFFYVFPGSQEKNNSARKKSLPKTKIIVQEKNNSPWGIIFLGNIFFLGSRDNIKISLPWDYLLRPFCFLGNISFLQVGIKSVMEWAMVLYGNIGFQWVDYFCLPWLFLLYSCSPFVWVMTRRRYHPASGFCMHRIHIRICLIWQEPFEEKRHVHPGVWIC